MTRRRQRADVLRTWSFVWPCTTCVRDDQRWLVTEIDPRQRKAWYQETARCGGCTKLMLVTDDHRRMRSDQLPEACYRTEESFP